MKNKKGLIILSSVIVVCAVALVISPIIDWPIDTSKSGGNISKSSRFSRKTASEGLSNMEELILNDPTYKNGIVTAYVVMQTRAQEFGALVDMSNEVAGEIPEFAEVLDDMNKVYVTVNNVCASLVRAGENINATLNGEQRPDLAQNTINASLAYTTLQKQNKLATRFIDVTDKYLQTAEGTDRLKFVRDQWVDYQRITAALEGDEKSAEALEKKGTLLSADKTASALGSFSLASQVCVLQNANIANAFSINNSVVNSFPEEVVANVMTALNSAYNTVVSNGQTVSDEVLFSAFTTSLAAYGDVENLTLAHGANAGSLAHGANAGSLASGANAGSLASGANAGSLAHGANLATLGFSNLIGSFTGASASMQNSTLLGSHAGSLCNQVGEAIVSTSMGNVPQVNIF